MNRTLKEATVRTYHYSSHAQLRAHLAAFLNAYNHAKRLKSLRGLTPHQFILSCFQNQPHRFKVNPHQHSMGLNIYRIYVPADCTVSNTPEENAFALEQMKKALKADVRNSTELDLRALARG